MVWRGKGHRPDHSSFRFVNVKGSKDSLSKQPQSDYDELHFVKLVLLHVGSSMAGRSTLTGVSSRTCRLGPIQVSHDGGHRHLQAECSRRYNLRCCGLVDCGSKGPRFESRRGTNVLWQDINLHLPLSIGSLAEPGNIRTTLSTLHGGLCAL